MGKLRKKKKLTNTTANLPVYGIYLDHSKRKKPLSKVDFKFTPIDFIAHWQRCGTTANYLAKFQSYNFDARQKVTSILSTVLNEMIENSIKFSADAYKEIQLSVYNYAENITVQTVNSTYKRQAENFQKYIQALLSRDPEEMFLENIMKNAEDDTSVSQLGLITLRKDFNAQIGVKVIPDIERRLYDIYIKVVLDTEEIEKF